MSFAFGSLSIGCALVLAACIAGGAVAACSSDDAKAPPGVAPAADAGADADAAGVLSQSVYPTLAVLHDRALSRTCSLNNGVCHNSKEFPDLHTPTNVVDLVGKNCNQNTLDKAEMHDGCEPEGDRLIVSWAEVDAEIVHVTIEPADVDFTKSGAALAEELALKKPVARVRLATPPAAFVIPEAQGDIAVQRGSQVFPLRESVGGAADGVYVKSVDGDTITLGLEKTSPALVPIVDSFLDDRVYPWTPAMVRVADPNGNGVRGHSLGVKMIVPGAPLKSYALLRLIDPSAGDMMPRVCREWTEEATRALGCWIEGLKTEGERVINADAPIDYDRCTFDVAGRGQCFSSSAGSVEAIFAKSCGGERCHVGQEAGGLELTAGKARANLVGIPSVGAPGKLRVKAGSVEESYLLCKIDPSCADRAGAAMPLGGAPLGPTEVAVLRSWIVAGAN